MPQDLIPANLPVYYRCLAFPVTWKAGASRASWKPVVSLGRERESGVRLSDMARATPTARDMDLLRATPVPGKPTFFDPKEKRNEFFRLQRGDTAELVSFLNTVGLFESEASLANVAGVDEEAGKVETAITETASGDYYSVPYHPLHSAKKIWAFRDLLVRGLKGNSELGSVCDFQTRIVRESNSPRVVITTRTLLDAVLLSIIVDRVKKAKVQKCARPDCGIIFMSDNRHKKKYCCRYCAHVESVRRDRERKKLLGISRKG